MAHYPLFLNLNDRICLVVGAGDVGKRKVRSLLAAGPKELRVVDAEPASDELQCLLTNSRVKFRRGLFSEADLQGVFLAVAATSHKDVNAEVGRLCREKGILVNVVDAPELCDFIVPAHFTRQGLSVAVSTDGGSPALARRLRRELEHSIGDKYTDLLDILRNLRPLMLELGMETDINTDVFRRVVESDLSECLNTGDTEGACCILRRELPDSLHQHIDGLLKTSTERSE